MRVRPSLGGSWRRTTGQGSSSSPIAFRPGSSPSSKCPIGRLRSRVSRARTLSPSGRRSRKRSALCWGAITSARWRSTAPRTHPCSALTSRRRFARGPQARRPPGSPERVLPSLHWLRLLMGMAALLEGSTTLSGDASLRKRPMGPLLDALTVLGARARSSSGDGLPPVEVEGVLRGGRVSPSGSVSSQFLSSLLIACPLAGNRSEIRVLPPRRSEPYVEMTRQMVRAFGVDIVVDEGAYLVPGGRTYRPTDLEGPGDFSSAAFPLVAAAITGGDVTVAGLDLGSLQGDARLDHLLEP